MNKEVLDDIEKQRNPIELTGLPWQIKLCFFVND